MTAETDAEFVEREWNYLTEGQQREPRWKRLFDLARRGADAALTPPSNGEK